MGTPRFRFDPILVENNECECPKCHGYKDPNSRICIYCFKRLDHVARKSGLTAQQEEVVKKFVETESIKQVATLMGIRYKTVESHLGLVRKRLDIATLYGVVKWAFRTGLISCFIVILFLGCSTPVTPVPPPSRVRKTLIPPQLPVKTMPPGEAAYAKAVANSKPQGIIVLPVSPPGSGVTTGAGTYPFKTIITITATAASGYAFSEWSDGNISTPRTLSVPKEKTTLTAFFTPLPPPPATNHFIQLAWNPSPATNIIAYAIKQGVASGNYTNVVQAGNNTSVYVSNLVQGVTYYFCAVAIAENGLSSVCSNEIKYP